MFIIVWCILSYFLYKKLELERKLYNPVPCCMNMNYLASVSVGILLLYKGQEILAKLMKAPF